MTCFPQIFRHFDGCKIRRSPERLVRLAERGIIKHSQDSVRLSGLFAGFAIIQNDYLVQSFCTVFRQIDRKIVPDTGRGDEKRFKAE